MRSRTSRGVPEWSGGKDLYMGSCHTDTGRFRGHIGFVPRPPKGFRGSTGRGHPSRGATWAAWGRSQPLEGWVPLPFGPMHLGLGGTLEGAPPLLGGQVPPPWPPPPSRSHLEGPAPLAPSPINRGVRGGLQYDKSRRSPSPPQHLSSSVRAWRSPVGILPRQLHHAVVLPLELPSSTSPSSLLDQDGGDVSRPVHVLNAEVLSVQH